MTRQKKARLIALLLAVALFALSSVASYVANNTNFFPTWTGFGTHVVKENTQRAKTLWDWLSLLVIPVLIAFATWLLNKTQKEIEEERAGEQRQLEQKRADDRRQLEQELAEKRERQETLEAYLDHMTTLIFQTNFGDPVAKEKLGRLARAHTITALQKLDGDGQRKGRILNFLYESHLINKKEPIVRLWGVNLKDAQLPEGTILVAADLSGALLSNADLPAAHLGSAVLVGTDLQDANLSKAHMVEATFIGKPPEDEQLIMGLRQLSIEDSNSMGHFLKAIEANLKNTNLSETVLTDAILIEEQLKEAKISNKTILPKVVPSFDQFLQSVNEKTA